MYLNDSVNKMLESTPTAYILYEIVKNSDSQIVDYKVMDYNPSFLKLISPDIDIVDDMQIENFIFNIIEDIPKLENSILSTFNRKIVGYTRSYKKWLQIYLFHEDDKNVVFQITDISKEKLLEKHLRAKSKEFELITNVIDDLILVMDFEGKIRHVNNPWKKTLGYEPDNLVDNNITQYVVSPSYNKLISLLKDRDTFCKGEILRTQMKHIDGSYRTLEWNCSVYKEYIYAVGRDISAIIEAQEKVLYLSYHDKLTGLYNRSFFEEELKRLDNNRNLPISIIIGDINGLKITNDVFGHAKGDALLKNIANILRNSVRRGDIVSRWGGDEFTILLPNTDEAATVEIINRVYRACRDKELILNYSSISLGYDIKYHENQSIYTTITNAENNMYANKSKDGKVFRENILSSMVQYLTDEKHQSDSSITQTKFYLRELAEALELSDDSLEKLLLLADVHDIGLISVPKAILNKKITLTEDDWAEIKKHSETGFRIAKSIPEISYIANHILYHHERYDGKGYPHGLEGQDIPYINRIFSVVDVYEALTQNKIYRSSFSQEEIVDCLIRNKGILFDPEIVDLFVDILKKEEKN